MAKKRLTQVCSIENCNRQQHGGGYCDSHYHRWKRHGDPLIKKAEYFDSIYSKEFAESFWSRVALTADDTRCWEWKAGKTAKGYGCVVANKQRYYAHRISWEFANGRPPTKGLEILHSCDNPSCVNPKHLREDTHKANMQEAQERNLMERGSQRHNALLNEESVREIRQYLADGKTGRWIAANFGVKEMAISNVKHGRSWKHVV